MTEIRSKFDARIYITSFLSKGEYGGGNLKGVIKNEMVVEGDECLCAQLLNE